MKEVHKSETTNQEDWICIYNIWLGLAGTWSRYFTNLLYHSALCALTCHIHIIIKPTLAKKKLDKCLLMAKLFCFRY